MRTMKKMKTNFQLKTQSIMKTIGKLFLTCTVVTLLSVASQAWALDWNPGLVKDVQQTIQAFEEKNSKFEAYFEESYGYAVFPSIGKGGVVVGGAHGKGLVFEEGQLIGRTKMTQITVGFQWGGQAYSEVIFFEDEEALHSFIGGDLELSGQASAVALDKGASADLDYEDGLAVFTQAKGGLMYEASIGGQKFKFFPDSSDSYDQSTNE